MEHRNPVGNPVRTLYIVRDDDTRHTEFLLHPNDQPVDYRHGDRIQSRRRFIIKQILRLRRDGPGEPGPLQHPTGQLRRIPVSYPIQIDKPQTLTHTGVDLLFIHPRDAPKPHRDIVGNVHGVEECGELKNVADVTAKLVELLNVEFTEVLAVHHDLTRVGAHQADNVLENHGLAGSGEPDDAECFPVLDREIQSPEDSVLAERPTDVTEHDAHSRTTAQNASRTRISMLDTTTARVVATPTPPAPPFAWNP